MGESKNDAEKLKGNQAGQWEGWAGMKTDTGVLESIKHRLRWAL